MNYAIREFEDNLIDFINKSDIPIEAKRLVIKDVFRQVERTAQNVINQELQLMEAQKNIEAQNKDEEATE